MASRTKLLTELSLADLWQEVKDPATLWGDLTPEAQRALKLLLQNRMHEELAHYLRAPWYGRVPGRRGYRNGTYVRALTTTWGTIPDLEIPRTRDGAFAPSVLPRYQRRMRDVDRLIQAVFLTGVSTRRVGRTLAELLGDTVSASTVSSVTRTLDHAVAACLRRQAWHRRPLHDEYRYLLLDGLSLRVKTPDGAKRRLILVAYGITQDGRRRLIDYRLALITTDGHRGLHTALELVYPTVPRQACWVHVLRNVAHRRRRLSAARVGSPARLLCRPGTGLAQGAHHQCDRTRLPRGPAPDTSDDLLHQ